MADFHSLVIMLFRLKVHVVFRYRVSGFPAAQFYDVLDHDVGGLRLRITILGSGETVAFF